MDENLIGYLLDALEEPDRRQVEAHLRSHPECQARLETLRRALAPLAVDAEAPAPPAGLPIRTLARIAEERARPLPKAPPPSPRAASSWRGPRRADLLAAAVLVLLLGGLAGPWIVQQWHLYGRQACASNLRTYGEALKLYAAKNNGQLPSLTEAGPRSYAASFVPTLHQAGYLANQHLACDPTGQRSDPPPSVDEVELARNQADMDLFRQRARRLAGNYAYTLGYREDGVLHGLSTEDSNHPILADHRPALVAGSNSPNHSNKGQNVLYVDGHVKWCASPVADGCGDHDIYHNCKGKIAAGLGRDDVSLGAGEAGP